MPDFGDTMKKISEYVNVFQGSGAIDLPKPEGIASRWLFIKALCGNTTPAAASPFGKMTLCAYTGGYPTGYGNILLGDSGWAQLIPFNYARDYNEETHELIIRFKAGAKEVAVGTRASFALANKTGTCFTGYQSDYLYWEDINVYCNPGMVFLYYNGSNIFFNNAMRFVTLGKN